MRYWDHGFGWSWLGLVMMVVTVVLFWGGLGTVVFLLLRRFGHVGQHGGAAPDANKILDERFARGEIDDEELARRRAALKRDT